MRQHFDVIAAVLVTFGLIATFTPHVASANTIVSYTGSHYTDIVDSPAIPGTYDTTMFVSGTLELATLGANFDGTVVPIHFSLNDGRFTITDVFASSAFHFTTDGTGAITKWYLEAHANLGGGQQLIIQSAHDAVFFFTVRDTGSVSLPTGAGDAGIVTPGGAWTRRETSSVPEPSFLSFLVIGLVGLGARLRKRIV